MADLDAHPPWCERRCCAVGTADDDGLHCSRYYRAAAGGGDEVEARIVQGTADETPWFELRVQTHSPDGELVDVDGLLPLDVAAALGAMLRPLVRQARP